MQDEDIDLSEISEINESQLERAVFRVGGKPLPKGKIRVDLLLDVEIVAYFKAQGGEQSFGSLINEALKANIIQRDFETALRRVIREELHAIK